MWKSPLLHVNLIQDLPVLVRNELAAKLECGRQFPGCRAPFIRDQPETVDTFRRIEALVDQVNFIVENACYFGMADQLGRIVG